MRTNNIYFLGEIRKQLTCYQLFRTMVHLVDLSTFLPRDIIFAFLFVLLHTKPLWWAYSEREDISSIRSKFFSFRVNPFSERQGLRDKYPSLKVYPD